ncbi:hypothetical protein ACQJ5L_03455, partial [Helicobacter pylori]
NIRGLDFYQAIIALRCTKLGCFKPLKQKFQSLYRLGASLRLQRGIIPPTPLRVLQQNEI